MKRKGSKTKGKKKSSKDMKRRCENFKRKEKLYKNTKNKKKSTKIINSKNTRKYQNNMRRKKENTMSYSYNSRNNNYKINFKKRRTKENIKSWTKSIINITRKLKTNNSMPKWSTTCRNKRMNNKNGRCFYPMWIIYTKVRKYNKCLKDLMSFLRVFSKVIRPMEKPI